jgi:hypothetical protein
MRLVVALALWVAAVCGVVGCVRQVELLPADARVDEAPHPDAALFDAWTADALPDAMSDAAPDAL